MKQKLSIFKIGGKVIDQEDLLQQFLQDFAGIQGEKLLVHGGGKTATEISARLGIKAQMVEGRRITDKATLEVVTMVYGGLLNKKMVAGLQRLGVNAAGFTGADLNLVRSRRRPTNPVDYGYVGDVESVNIEMLSWLIQSKIVPVMAPLSFDGAEILNTNADSIAAGVAIGLAEEYDVNLFYCFEKNGVLMDPENNDSVIPQIAASEFDHLKNEGVISEGMIPKLQGSFDCIASGVSKVVICNFSAIGGIGQDQVPGTQLIP
jgi:acetylglutamate kinase